MAKSTRCQKVKHGEKRSDASASLVELRRSTRKRIGTSWKSCRRVFWKAISSPSLKEWRRFSFSGDVAAGVSAGSFPGAKPGSSAGVLACHRIIGGIDSDRLDFAPRPAVRFRADCRPSFSLGFTGLSVRVSATACNRHTHFVEALYQEDKEREKRNRQLVVQGRKRLPKER